MNEAICSLAHFCELHGPTTLLCTQSFPPDQSRASLALNATRTGTGTGTNTSTGGSCPSCSLLLPKTAQAHLAKTHSPPLLRTVHANKAFVSSRTPQSQRGYANLRQACLRTLSCELLPGTGRQGSVFFSAGGEEEGATVAHVFRIADARARGGQRWYALLYVHPQEWGAVRAWRYVSGMFEGLAAGMVKRAKRASERTVRSSAASTGSGSGSGSGTGTGTSPRSPEGFLRRRDAAVPRSLCDLLDSKEIFVELHAQLATILYQLESSPAEG